MAPPASLRVVLWALILLQFTLTACARNAATPASVGGAQPAATATAAGSARQRRCVLVSIDGLLPETYLAPDAHGLRVPTLRRLVAQGAFSEGALSVFPSVTYPSHTSIATGVRPARHGIVSNGTFDPLDTNLGGWRWYAEDIRVPPIWQLAEQKGLRAALIGWPVSVGAQVSWLVPEYWRAGNEDDRKLIRALSTPGLLDAVSERYAGFWQRFPPPSIQDEAATDIAHFLLAGHGPDLLLMHIFQVDGAQHRYGLWSPEALAAIEHADAQLARLLAVVEQAAADTLFMVVSDHGFVDVKREVNPGALLREAGFVTTAPDGRVLDWKAAVLASGGQAYVYLREPAAAGVGESVGKLLSAKLAAPESGLARIYDRDAIAEVGGDPAAFLALEAQPGVVIGDGYGEYEGATKYKAAHGYDPRRPELKASLLWFAPGVVPGKRRDGRLVDVAPTIARWLGLTLPGADGVALQ
jgi:predicted AlkP superfamily pyrophosphatase or phosphodiesterase